MVVKTGSRVSGKFVFSVLTALDHPSSLCYNILENSLVCSKWVLSGGEWLNCPQYLVRNAFPQMTCFKWLMGGYWGGWPVTDRPVCAERLVSYSVLSVTKTKFPLKESNLFFFFFWTQETPQIFQTNTLL